MAYQNRNFNHSVPLYLTSVDWKNPHHRRSAATSLVQGVYSQEHDRQQNRPGHQALAPPWWDFFNFRLSRELVDNDDRSIFGAIYEFKSPPPYGHYNPLHNPPRYVVAFRGTMTGWETMSQDVTLDLKVIQNTLEQSARFQQAMQAVQCTVFVAGAANMWLAGHSLGSAMALPAGKNMAKMGCFLETYLFNPLFISIPIEVMTKTEIWKSVIQIMRSVTTAGAQRQRPQTGDWFAALSQWIPYLFVNLSDPISAEYVGYFEHRETMEAIGAGAIERLSTRNSILGAIEPLHLLPSAYLTINGSPIQGLGQAHGLDQWWKPNIQRLSKLYRLISETQEPVLESVSSIPSPSSSGGPSEENNPGMAVSQVERSRGIFSLDEIKMATHNFNDARVIGVGGFGKVYQGFINNGATVVAIKRLNAGSRQGAIEFWTEIELLSKLRHTHLIELIGYCEEGQEMILVYEYVSCGTLADHLFKRRTTKTNTSTSLTWEQRLNICIGASRGLEHLHAGTNKSFIHRDVKTTNILLDENWVAKISDFELSKGPTSHSITHISTAVKGTFGYLDIDYFYTQRLTTKSDVYAFGVVLLEVLCGRPAVDTKPGEEPINLVQWAKPLIKQGNLDRLVDPSLNGQIGQRCLISFVAIANNCVHESPNLRPTMAEVSSQLEHVLSVQRENKDQGVSEIYT